MKNIFLLLLAVALNGAGLQNIHSFEADFTQSITNDKNSTLTYRGHVQASKPQLALWHYISPVEKSIYISNGKATVVEPDLEQAYIQDINRNFDFFHLIKNAKKVGKNSFVAKFQDTKYILKIIDNKLISISYKDELENSVVIIFTKQRENKIYKRSEFTPIIPIDYDIVRG